jgi:hypothetical protein
VTVAVAPGAAPVVFLGPSLPREEADQLLSARFLPPAAMGDVYRAVTAGARVIALIDGVFDQVPSVWHKEILWALEQGVAVYGAASMGALRAAELSAFGMRGVGQVFAAFAAGELEDDDEVAVCHGDAGSGFRPLSEAMVNLRHGLAGAVAAGVISAALAARLVEAAKARFYPERSWAASWAEAEQAGATPAEVQLLKTYLRKHRPNLKRQDAVELLTLLAAGQASSPHVDWHMERTLFWQRMVDTVSRPTREPGVEPGVDGSTTQHATVTFEAVRDAFRVGSPAYAEVRRGALLLELVEREARRAGLKPDRTRLAAAAERFRREHGLLSVADLQAFWQAQWLTRETFAEFVEREALLDMVAAPLGLSWERHLPHELRRRQALGPAVDDLQGRQQLLARRGNDRPTLDDAGVSLDQLLAWYRRRRPAFDGSIEREARALGFTSTRNFLDEVLDQYLAAATGGSA